MSQAKEGTGRRIVELANQVKDEQEEVSEQEAAEMLDLIVMRATNLAVVKGGLDWEDAAEQLELSTDVARQMANRDE